MATLEDVFRLVRLQAPDVPPMVARRFVLSTYLDLANRRGWQWLRKETTLTTLASRSVAVTVVLGNPQVTSAALFVASDVGRQFRVGFEDTYTILTFTNASTIVLDRPYIEDSGAETATILNAYVTVPAGFGRFDCLVDLQQQRRLPFWTSQDELNRIDPMRSTGGSPRLLSPRLLDPVTGRPTYEWWPRPSGALSFPALYFEDPSSFADTDPFEGVLTNRTDVLEAGALRRAARYPGTKDHPNGYFNLALSRDLAVDFERLANQLDLRDDDVAQQSWTTDEQWGRWSAWDYAANLNTLRATDAGIGEYLGGY